MWCNLLLSSAETIVSSKKSSNMRDGQGCLLPVLRRYIEPEGEEHLMVQLLLPTKSCKAKVVQHLDVKPHSLSEKRKKRPRRAKSVFGSKIAIRMLDTGVLQDCAMRENAPDADGEIVSLRVCAVATVGPSDSASIMQNVSVITSKMAESKATTLGSPFWTSILDSSTVKDQEDYGKSKEAQKDEDVVDKSYIPGLPDAVALLCLAYVPVTKHWLLASLSRKHRELVRDSLLFSVRFQNHILDQWICIYTSGIDGWRAFKPRQDCWNNLPRASVDPNFETADKESLAAGTHLLWVAQVAFEFACYKYDVVSDSWERGPRMVNPRCLFGSATCGQYAYVAGGFSVGGMQFNVLNSAERYDSLTGKWEPLPPMNTPRHKCSGFFMDGKFYVIGGKTRNHEQLTSGEEFDPVKNVWRTIEDMYSAPALPPTYEPSPPLVAVAGNELYAIESSTNLLKVYEKDTNRWRALGLVPVRADFCNGWGLAFKALGDRLFVIGGHRYSSGGVEGIAVFSCRPQPGASAPEWQLVNNQCEGTGSFLFNCAVMAF